jgi:hypothetical protein
VSERRIAPAAVFVAIPPRELPTELRLRAAEWGVYFSLTGKHTVAQLRSHLDLAASEVEAALGRLVELGVAREAALSLGDYLQAAASVEAEEPMPLTHYLRGGLAGPSEEAVRTEASAELETLDPLPFEPLPLAGQESDVSIADLSVRGPATAPRISLRALMDVLMRRAPDADSGQLDVYRTFLRVDPELLRRNGIVTLHFEDDRVVSDPELLEAIVVSTERTLGGPVPARIYLP